MKKSYKIEVDCANCANLVEEALQKVAGVESANVSFVMQKMKVVYADGADTAAIEAEILKVAKKIEPDFKILG